MNNQGNNWGAFGKKDTGKSFEVLEFAGFFREREHNPKATIVFDHSNNLKTYGHIEQVIPIERLRYELPKRAIVKVQSLDFGKFAQYVLLYQRNVCVIVDDSSKFYRGNLNGPEFDLLKTPKNNHNEYFFQSHNIEETAPDLLRNLDLFIVKETTDDPANLPAKLTARRWIVPLLEECRDENQEYEPRRKWATRIFDRENHEIWVRNIDVPPGTPIMDCYAIMDATEYIEQFH